MVTGRTKVPRGQWGLAGCHRRLKYPPASGWAGAPSLGGMWGSEEQVGVLQGFLGDAYGRRGGGWREDLEMLPSPGS